MGVYVMYGIFDLLVRNYRISCESTRMGGGVMV